MKRISIIAVALMLGILLVAPAGADYIPQGVSFTAALSPWHLSGFSGGAFAVYEPPGSYGSGADFYTFCVEKYEYFTPGQTLYVGSVGTTIKYNGSSTPVTINLDQRVAKLYHDYSLGILPGQLQDGNFDKLVQEAIWHFQYDTAITTSTNPFLENATYANWTGGLLDVVVMNLYTDSKSCNPAQDMLGTNPGITVPEPGTLLLMGLGLVGLAGLRRKE